MHQLLTLRLTRVRSHGLRTFELNLTAQMIEPSYALDLGNDTTAPTQNMLLASVHGIRSQGLTRGALAYNRLGGLVYPTSAIGVVYNRKEHRQVVTNEPTPTHSRTCVMTSSVLLGLAIKVADCPVQDFPL